MAPLFELSQERLMDRQRQENAVDAMKTTMNLLLIDGKDIRWGHVGDSRTYYFRKGKDVRAVSASLERTLLRKKRVNQNNATWVVMGIKGENGL